MNQEFIRDCLNVLNAASSPYDHLDYDDESKEFVAYYCYDIADPDGMGGLTTKVHEAYRYSEEEVLELMYGLCPAFYADEALDTSCIIQSEIPQEAWDSECERVLDEAYEQWLSVIASDADYLAQEQVDLQWEAGHMY